MNWCLSGQLCGKVSCTRLRKQRQDANAPNLDHLSWLESMRGSILSIKGLQNILKQVKGSSSPHYILQICSRFFLQKGHEIVAYSLHCVRLGYAMSWEEQRRIALRRKHVAEVRSVHEWLEIAFQQSRDLGWKEEEFIQAVQEVISKAKHG